MKCASCGSEEKVKNHHIAYTPEVAVALCTKCHAKVHLSGIPKPTFDGIAKTLVRDPIIITYDTSASKKRLEFRLRACIREIVGQDSVLEDYLQHNNRLDDFKDLMQDTVDQLNELKSDLEKALNSKEVSSQT